MRKLFTVFVAVVLCVLRSVAHADEPAPLSRAEYILQKVVEADMLCEKATLSATIEMDSTGVRSVAERPIVLCAYGEETKTWHTITLALQYPVPKEYVACVRGAPTLEERRNCVLPLRVVTPGYRIEHLRGYGITRFTVNVYREDEKLNVYRTRHLWFDDDALASKDVDRIVATARGINYTPHHPDFDDEDLVRMGARFLHHHVSIARYNLGTDSADTWGVRSQAFPGQLLGEVVPWEIPMALAIIEQMDDKTFLSDKKRTSDRVLIEYALNGDDAFRFAQSSANAIGALQFTAPTYASMVANYPSAQLESSFEVGARNLDNVLKAAICLIDKEIAQFPESKQIYARNPKLGGAFSVAAYNGGPPAAKALFEWLRRNKVSIERHDVNLPTAFTSKRVEVCPCKNVPQQHGKKVRSVTHFVTNTETPGYLEKYLYILNYLADQGLE